MKTTDEQLDIIEEIANAKDKFGIWSIVAERSIKHKKQIEFIQAFRDQLKYAPDSMEKNFPEYIINTLKTEQ